MIIAEPCPLSEAAAHHLAENRAGMPGYAERKLLASTIQDTFLEDLWEHKNKLYCRNVGQISEKNINK